MGLEAMMTSPGQHLVVLQHGFGGTATNMLSIFRSLQSALPCTEQDFKVLNVHSNEGLDRTKEGIRVCGERLFRDIMHELHLNDGTLAYTELSIIGYSAGGLFARYVVGCLEESGVLGALRCASFVTIATPHLGCVRPSDGTWRTMLWNQGGGLLDRLTKPIRPKWTDGGKAVDELFLRDGPWFACGEPAMLEMAEPHSRYVRGLSRFARLVAIANARADRTVPCETAAILPENPFEGLEAVEVEPVSAEFPHVAHVMEAPEATSLIQAATKERRRYFEGFNDAAMMQRMVDGLSTLPWQRVFAWLPGGHTHGTVIARQWSTKPEHEAAAMSSCGQDVVAFASAAVAASVGVC